MKRQIAFLLCMVCLVTSITSVAHAKDAADIETVYTIVTPYEYPVTPDMDEWKAFQSHVEMIDACQIPEEILENMSTEALAETVLNYPLLTDMLAWSDRSLGVQHVASYFNGLEELLSRNNGIDYLLNTTIAVSNQSVLEDESGFVERNKVRCAALIVANAMNAGEAAPMTTRSMPTIETGDIRTPNNSLVPYYKDLDFTDLNRLFGSSVPFTQNEFDDLERSYEVNYPNATKIGGISPSYNCHTYAWYSTVESPYWITDIWEYLTDGSYIVVSAANASAGDVVTYWANVSDVSHSAVVRNYRNGHYNLNSKWDFMGVYSHRDDYCPYYTGSYTLRAHTRT